MTSVFEVYKETFWIDVTIYPTFILANVLNLHKCPDSSIFDVPDKFSN